MVTGLTIIDLLLRGAALGTLVMAVAIICLARPRSPAAKPVSAFGAMVAGYLLASAPWAGQLPDWVNRGATTGAVLAPFGLTWVMLTILTDPPFRRLPLLMFAALTVAVTGLALIFPEFSILRGVMAGALYLSLIGVALITAPGDLVPERQRFRAGLLAAVALMGVAITIAELVFRGQDLPYFVFPLQAAAIWALSVAFAVWALVPSRALVPPPPPARPAARDRDLVMRLQAAMEGGAWKEEGLTIGALANSLAVPEHQLRATINGALGHRNFPAFVNGYRIDAAKQVLSDPAQARRTILEIAYDSGFASIGPFNRAFRAETGRSPSEYRAAPD